MRVALLLILSLVALSAPSTSFTSEEVVRRMEARYKSAKTLEAAFLEQYTDNGRIVRAEAGRAYFKRPGKMRWEYEAPEKNLFLVDGKTAWFYTPSDHTVMRMPAKESADWRTPLALLAGEMKVSRVCSRVDFAENVKPQLADNVMLFCVVRGEEQAGKNPGGGKSAAAQESPHKVYFEVAPSTGELARVVVQDPGGVSVEFQFKNWKFDPDVPEVQFHFQAPVGVAIVNGEMPAGGTSTKP